MTISIENDKYESNRIDVGLYFGRNYIDKFAYFIKSYIHDSSDWNVKFE